MPSPSLLPLPVGSSIQSLSCPSSSFCAAVGAAARQPVILLGSFRP
jgi:hypothetical protein